MTPDLLSSADVAALAGVKRRTINAYTQRHLMPAPSLYLDNKPVWERAVIEAWLSERRGVGRPRKPSETKMLDNPRTGAHNSPMTTTQGFQGSKYDSLGQYPSAATIAKAIRNDIKAAVASGDLLGKPVTYRVVSDTFSMGCSVDVTIRDFPGAWVARNEYPGDTSMRLTDEAVAYCAKVEAIHAAYNHNNSDTMTDYFDVRYYGHVSFESEWAQFNRRAAKVAK